mmetsp:Transcript_9499/g.12885  ORF Transcript_9499/g.12885 Transcript_9499/m.12885 type:complete len:567 (+) Transcript_9499:54-1754(+)|eukprot:CAMPEP_0196573704 /NCGR_PEP_ID=MMETSP1081-20130531/3567_1 /TAXON_ID=36882 /ORGANISM="Pyramimonas amylifera, Strain CCMP720" /LENGTH=566 /DNA_ID=CAMNT_0041891519 /DNA_START=33 /DNA_END=1733 /DNA_ORIENTATION=-
MASSNTNFRAGDEWRKAKDLEEARKAGLAPAEVDEDGKEINPHIPQYMAAAPWYLNSNHAGLKHQKNWNAKEAAAKEWYDRGAKVFQADKFRKGACENCGSMTHKRNDCLERARKKGARWTGVDIAADDKITTIKLDFEGKRDRWNGYDASQYAKVMDRFQKVEELKTELQKEKELEKKFRKQQKHAGEKERQDGDSDEDEGEEEDDEKVAEEDMGDFGKVAKRVRTAGGGASGTVRNLRIREDTAKYLRNLDMSSAHYDPKTRSMREDPTPNVPAQDKFFAGDNFVRYSGDTQEFNKQISYAWDAYSKGQEIHMQAAPSQAQYLHANFHVKKQQLTEKTKGSILDKYGDASLDAGLAKKDREELDQERALLLGQTEQYVEYDRAGRVIKGAAPAMAKSKYPEDEYVNNHTQVWGSFWTQGQWGYACCHSTVKPSYCTGAAGQAAAAAASRLLQTNMENKEKEALASSSKEEEEKNPFVHKKIAWGTDVDESLKLDPAKLQLALAKEEEINRKGVETDDRKRGYNVHHNTDVTDEEMEAYRLKKQRADDPMKEITGGSGTSGYDMV